jgi:hypothetical protein
MKAKTLSDSGISTQKTTLPGILHSSVFWATGAKALYHG